MTKAPKQRFSIPRYLSAHAWYAPHQAWLRSEGVPVHHAIPKGTISKRADLRGVDLSKAILYGANLPFADFSGANFFKADLSGANLSNADLVRTNFFGADLSRVLFCWADLSYADLSEAYLSNAFLSEAKLEGLQMVGGRGSDDLGGRTHLSQLLSGAWVVERRA